MFSLLFFTNTYVTYKNSHGKKGTVYPIPIFFIDPSLENLRWICDKRFLNTNEWYFLFQSGIDGEELKKTVFLRVERYENT